MALVLKFIWNPAKGPSCEDLQQTIVSAIDNDSDALNQLLNYTAWDTDYASYDYNGLGDNMWKTARELCEEICSDCLTLFPCDFAIRQNKDGAITEDECFATCEEVGRELECNPKNLACDEAIQQKATNEWDVHHEIDCLMICEEVGREEECSGFLINGLSFVMFAILAILRN